MSKQFHSQIILVCLTFMLLSTACGQISGTSSAKDSILGKWELKESSDSSLTCGFSLSELEFLKGDIVMLEGGGSFTYSFPQDGYLNIGGNTGQTFKYEVSKAELKMYEDDGYCTYTQVK